MLSYRSQTVSERCCQGQRSKVKGQMESERCHMVSGRCNMVSGGDRKVFYNFDMSVLVCSVNWSVSSLCVAT